MEEGQNADDSALSPSKAHTKSSSLADDEGTTSESTEQQGVSSLPLGQQREFELDTNATNFFEASSKISVFRAVESLLPKSRAAGERVTASRPFSIGEMMQRKGRNEFAVQTPVRIDANRVLLLIAANYKKLPRPIIYDERDNSVSFSEKAVSSIIKDMSGNKIFDPELLEAMDTACEAFLQAMILGPTEDSIAGEFVCFACVIVFASYLICILPFLCCRSQRTTG
jgi:hypothetical protein